MAKINSDGLSKRKIKNAVFYESIANAQKIMDDFYAEQRVADSPLVTLIGQTHIDVAWLWTKKQVKEKAMRSFATALELMSEYDDFKFMMSQPALYCFVKKENPKLYSKIKQAVKSGKWEVNGALWVESDCNMISGESMARQLLYGKRFFKKEFGKDVKVAWLPDTFGFSGALPQIFKKAGVNCFVTSKLTWNEEDTMPYDTFSWKGIDGSKILGYFLTAQDYKREGVKERLTIYNAMLTVSQVFGSVDRYEPKRLNNDVLLSYGFGDGGGGPTEEYLETMTRLNKGINGIPKTESGTLGAFMDKIVKKLADNKALPEWSGELYFEHHRGTYTSIAKIKANNRKAEFSLLNAEAASVIAKVLFGISYPKEKLYDAWTLALTNQFHDVLPGSAIKEVYAETEPEYEKIFGFTDETVNFFMKLLQDSIADNLYVVFNPNAKTDKDYVRVDGKYYSVENLPSKGYKSVSLTDGQCGVYTADKKIWNKFYTVSFDDDYNVVSIVDNRVNRELVRKGCVANKFVAYEDYNVSCDAWEIQSYRAALRMLSELHYSCTFINPDMDFSPYKLLVIPDSFDMSEELIKKLDDYISNGGKLLSSGTAALNRDKTAFAIKDYDYIKFCGLDKSKRAYFKLNRGFKDYSDSVWSIYYYSKDNGEIGGTAVKMKNNGGKEIASYVSAYFDIMKPGIHGCYYTPPKEVTEFSSAILGENSAHVSFDVFTDYGIYFLSAQKELVRQLIEELLPNPVVKTSDLPTTARITIAKKNEYDLLHIKVTYPEHRNFRAIIEEHNVSEQGKTVFVKGKYVAAQVVPNGEILKLTYENGYTGITLPRIVGYAMIMLKK